MPTGNLTLDSVAVGRRFACCRNIYPTREDLEKVEWQTGIIRAATENDIADDDQQFCVEWDGKDPVRDYQWIYLHDTLEEDRCENVEGGDFGCFLIEDKIMWCDVDGLSNGNGVKSSKQHSHKNFKPVSTFIPLLDHMNFESRGRVPVYLLAESRLVFVDKDQTNSYPVQQHQTSLTIKGLSIPVQKDHQIAINHWFDTRRTQQRLIVDKDKHLVGQSVQVYWKDGANQRWYAACLKGFNNKDNTVTVMDYNVIQDRKVDPRLEEIRIVKDQGRSIQSTTSASPTPTETTDAGRRSRRTSTAKTSSVIEAESKPPAKKRGPKREEASVIAKRGRGRPAKSAKKKEPTPVSDSEEEDLPLKQATIASSESDNDEEPSWSLSKLTAKQQKTAAAPVTPAKRKKAPVSKSPLPIKKRFQTKKGFENDDYSSPSEEIDSEAEASETHSEASSVPVKKKSNKKLTAKAKKPRKVGRGRKNVKEREDSEGRHLPARTRKQPVSYRETSDDESEEKVKEPEPASVVKEPTPPPPPVKKPVKERKQMKKEKATAKKRKGASPIPAAENPVLDKPRIEEPLMETRNEPVGEKQMERVRAKSIDRSPPQLKNSLIAALTAPAVVSTPSVPASSWTNIPPSKSNNLPTTTVVESGLPKKMARVAGQPQGPPNDPFPREPIANHHRPDAFSVHNSRSTERPPAATIAAPLQPQSQPTPPPVLPTPTAQAPGPDFYHQQVRYSQHANQSYVPPPYQPYGQQPAPPTSQAAHAQPRQIPQQNAAMASSLFRATTPSPFVPRNSPVSNPQQQQAGSQPASSQAQNSYRPSSNNSAYQTQQHSQQNYPSGAMMSAYGTPAFYYQNPMGATPNFGSTPGAALMYGTTNTPGVVPMYPVHLATQGGQWDPGMLYNMMPGLPHGVTNEHYVRMAAAAQAAAANNRAAVRSTATSPDLRQHTSSNPLTGVISGAMQALNNFQIPSPPLGGTGIPSFMANSRHVSASPAPTHPTKNYSESSSASRDRPSSSTSHSSHLSNTSRSSPHIPTRSEVNEDGRHKVAEKLVAKESPVKPERPEKEAKKSSKKKTPSPKTTVTQVSILDQSRAQANEPCPLAMLSSIATTMKPVETTVILMNAEVVQMKPEGASVVEVAEKISVELPIIKEAPHAWIEQKVVESAPIQPAVNTTQVKESEKVADPEPISEAPPKTPSPVPTVELEMAPLVQRDKLVSEPEPVAEVRPASPFEVKPTSLEPLSESEEVPAEPELKDAANPEPTTTIPPSIVNYPISDEEDDCPRLRICEETSGSVSESPDLKQKPIADSS